MGHRPATRTVIGLAGAALVAAGMMAPAPAHAWWRGGVAIGVPFPFFVPPVVVAPPPAYYYGPPPIAYAPPPYVPPVYAQGGPPPGPGQTCRAGAYVCPLEHPYPVGINCSCPANAGGRVYGTVR